MPVCGDKPAQSGVQMTWRFSGPEQGWRIRGFEGARAPPECTDAPSHCQKHPLKIEENVYKTSFKICIQQRYGDLSFIRGKSVKETAEFPPFALN